MGYGNARQTKCIFIGTEYFMKSVSIILGEFTRFFFYTLVTSLIIYQHAFLYDDNTFPDKKARLPICELYKKFSTI